MSLPLCADFKCFDCQLIKSSSPLRVFLSSRSSPQYLNYLISWQYVWKHWGCCLVPAPGSRSGYDASSSCFRLFKPEPRSAPSNLRCGSEHEIILVRFATKHSNPDLTYMYDTILPSKIVLSVLEILGPEGGRTSDAPRRGSGRAGLARLCLTPNVAVSQTARVLEFGAHRAGMDAQIATLFAQNWRCGWRFRSKI